MRTTAIPLKITSTATTFTSNVKEFIEATQTYFSAALSNDSDASYSTRSSARSSNNKFFKKNSFPIIVGAVALLTILAAGYLLNRDDSASATIGDEDQRVEVQKPKATQTLNKTYSFPLRDSSGKEVSKIKYEILTAELRDQFIHKGRRATAIEGRTFVILNLKVTNDFNRGIQINTRDYVRIVVNNSKERLAPDIHNDPVEIQAISTKYTRLGFPINDTDKNIILQVGEINGKKENINLSLQ